MFFISLIKKMILILSILISFIFSHLLGELEDKISQTQVFCNMGFAYAQTNENLKALKSFQLAIQAAKDCGDKNAQFRAAEGINAINNKISC